MCCFLMEKVVYVCEKNKISRLFRSISKGMGIFYYLCVCGYVLCLCAKQIKGKSKRFVWYVVKTIETALMVASVCLCVYFWG